jgi:hypothetical protein
MQEPKSVPAAGATPLSQGAGTTEQLHPGTWVPSMEVSTTSHSSFTLTILTMDHATQYLGAWDWKNYTHYYFGPSTFIVIQHSLQTPNLAMSESIIKSLTSMASNFAPSRDCLHG